MQRHDTVSIVCLLCKRATLLYCSSQGPCSFGITRSSQLALKWHYLIPWNFSITLSKDQQDWGSYTTQYEAAPLYREVQLFVTSGVTWTLVGEKPWKDRPMNLDLLLNGFAVDGIRMPHEVTLRNHTFRACSSLFKQLVQEKSHPRIFCSSGFMDPEIYSFMPRGHV